MTMTNSSDKKSAAHTVRKRRAKNYFQDIGIAVVVGCITFLLLHYVVYIGVVPSESMENSIPKDSIIFSSRIDKTPERGDVVVFYDGEKNVVKRTIGQPGDRIKFTRNDVYVNGKKLDENYLKEKAIYEEGSFELSDNEYFVLGDNRNDSYDSRYIGPIKQATIIATKVIVIHDGKLVKQ